MNSLPLISHHLFVAAIGNEDRGHERPARRERLSAGSDGGSHAFALAEMGAGKPRAEDAAGVLRERLSEVRA
jgi:hypothetical protein